MTSDDQGLTVRLGTLAQSHADRAAARAGAPAVRLDRLAADPLRIDEDFCRAVADRYDTAPTVRDPAGMARGYARLAEENLRQFRLIGEAGIRVLPWSGPGQPYRDSRDLVARVRSRGRLHVFLTRHGHGPAGAGGEHPLRAPSGVRAGGEELLHNDIFRAVHDVFGHVLYGNTFGPHGEFRATRCHLAMYPADLHPLVFAELVGQLCWFFYGPHLRRPDGTLPRRGEPGYLPPARRPYPPQKQLAYDRHTLDRFAALFGPPSR
ncbi:hypothetical protein ACQPYA_19395 [Micromonospora sp. CA-263727]|uniref:hypothetical protein n=1 Tax=Micromonospora sp. CA-263727 TaxID=3239967 RepID=UPI003D949B8F